jgi:predicted  nucleic acid-binding Zn-ribbon protein
MEVTMTSADLDALYLLHRVDVAIAEIKRRAGAMDPGREHRDAMDQLKPSWEAAKAEAEKVSASAKDAELRQATAADKVKEINTLLYSGKLHSPKEIAAYQQEMAMFEKQRDQAETEALELMELVPTAKKKAEVLTSKMRALQAEYKKAYDAAVEDRGRMESDYKNQMARRPELAAKVNAGLLKQYDAIRARAGGIGMSEISDRGACGRCGTILPTKTIALATDGKLAFCESCKRILISMVGG